MRPMLSVTAMIALAGASLVMTASVVADTEPGQRPAEPTNPEGGPLPSGQPQGAYRPDASGGQAANQGRRYGGDWNSRFAEETPQGGYGEWSGYPPGEWSEPAYQGWGPEPSTQITPGAYGGRETPASAEAEPRGYPQRQEGPPVGASSQPIPDPWAATATGAQDVPSGQAADVPPAPRSAGKRAGLPLRRRR